jgi:AcrR family transcriptional regulator
VIAPAPPTAGTRTRQRLVDAAIALVADGGEDALTLRALGERCGLSRQAPYRHFEDKDSLLRAMAAGGFRELTVWMGDAAGPRVGAGAGGGGGAGLRRAMHAYVDWALANPAWYRLTFQNRAVTPASKRVDPELTEAAHGLLALVSELVVAAQRTGKMPPGPPKALVGVLWSTLHGAIDLALAGHAKPELGTATPHQVVDRLARIMATPHPG